MNKRGFRVESDRFVSDIEHRRFVKLGPAPKKYTKDGHRIMDPSVKLDKLREVAFKEKTLEESLEEVERKKESLEEAEKTIGRITPSGT